MKHNDIKLLLVQLRLDPVMHDQEFVAICRSAKISSNQITTINGVEQEISESDLDGHHMLYIAGSGDFSVFDTLPITKSLTQVLVYAKSINYPVVGNCWGGQFLAQSLGGIVETDPVREEIGSYVMRTMDIAAEDALFYDAPDKFWAQQGHHQSITKLPEGAINLITSNRCEIQAFTWPGLALYGFQLHADLNKIELIQRVKHYRASYAADPALYNAIIDNAKSSEYTDDLIFKFIDRIVLKRWL